MSDHCEKKKLQVLSILHVFGRIISHVVWGQGVKLEQCSFMTTNKDNVPKESILITMIKDQGSK